MKWKLTARDDYAHCRCIYAYGIEGFSVDFVIVDTLGFSIAPNCYFC